MTSTTATRPVSSPTTSRSWVESAAIAWSAIATAIGAWWLAVPSAYPDELDRPEADGSLVALVPPPLVSTLMVALGVVGLLAAVAASRQDARRSRWLVPFGAIYAVVFGLLATDLSLLVSMGYITAIVGPPILFVYFVLASVRRPSLRWVVGGAAVAFVGIAAASGAGLAAFGDFFGTIGDGLGKHGVEMLVVFASFLGGALWLLLALRAAGLRPVSAAATVPFTPARNAFGRRDWGWWVTALAALCPLPYASMRMTWLTPWPVWMDAAQLNAEPAMRVFGLSLGFAAIGGSVLTLGLLMRWGSVYPRWIPIVAGRTVSPVWPTVLAIIVGIAVTVAGRSLTQMMVTGVDVEIADPEFFLVMPFPVWGPLLIAAAIAYYRRRTTALSGTPETQRLTMRTSRD